MPSFLRRRSIRLVGIVVVTCLFVLWQRRVAAPQVVQLKAPVRVVSFVFDSVDSFTPSPDGQLVAVQAQLSSGTTWNGKPLLALFSVQEKREVARLPLPSHTSEVSWDKRNHLWVERGNGWDVWQAPWKAPSRVEACINPKIWKSIGAEMLAFDPNSQTVALSLSHEASLPVQIQLWRSGKLLCAAKITKSETQAGGLGTSIEAARWSPDGSQLAFSLSGYIGVDQDSPHELWVFDVASKQLRMVARGAVEEWVIADPNTQNTEPAWSRDGRTLFWGDKDFGINATDVQSGKERAIYDSAWSGDAPMLSPSGRSLTFTRGNTLVVAATDGSRWARGPSFHDSKQWTWNPARDQLFLLSDDEQGTTSLWAWDATFPDATP